MTHDASECAVKARCCITNIPPHLLRTISLERLHSDRVVQYGVLMLYVTNVFCFPTPRCDGQQHNWHTFFTRGFIEPSKQV